MYVYTDIHVRMYMALEIRHAAKIIFKKGALYI